MCVTPLATNKGLVLDFHLTNGLPQWFSGDHARLHQIILNLVSNAVKFTDDGSVTVAVDYQAGMLRVAVTDSGIGMSEEDLEKLGNRLFKWGMIQAEKQRVPDLDFRSFLL